MKLACILAVPTGLGLGCAVVMLALYLGIGVVDTTEGIA